MSKLKSAFFCQNCGYESAKWIGKCYSCGEWNTFVEELVSKNKNDINIGFSVHTRTKSDIKSTSIHEIKGVEHSRYQLKDGELNRVLGGGLVLGSLILFGGEPGIGKSTLMLQLSISNDNLRVLYVSGEESEIQIKMRAERIGLTETKNECFILSETNIENIFKQAENIKPKLIIIDSIQTLYSSEIESSPGSISQVRECSAQLLRYAKITNTPIFLIGHITKEGYLAGPKVLEHMVDTVLQFEGDRNNFYRLLRSVKNRFGSTNELGIYEMVGSGLRQIDNPSEILITNFDTSLSGISIGAIMEGLRPMLIEVQALVSTAAYGTPQRSSTGYDSKRLNMLLAVMEKRCGFKLGAKDVFLNIAGGIKVDDPALDLAVAASVLSSNADIAIVSKICLSAEIGLSGEIRPVNRVDQRIREAEKLGFDKIIISKFNKNINQKDYKIEIIFCKRLDEVVRFLFT
jgi:DNA repair protein RadA/Sms